MNAEAARKLSQETKNTLTTEAHLLLGRWHDAIKEAASAGRRSLRENQVQLPPITISQETRTAVLNQLTREGFNVVQVKHDQSLVAEVNW